MPKETTITNKILKYLNELPECKAIKMHGSQFSEAGTPDIMAVYRGTPLFIEVKQPGKKPTKIQRIRLEQWRLAGAVAFWTDSLKDVKGNIEAIGNKKIKAIREEK